MKLSFRFLTTLGSLTIAAISFGWNATGHMIIGSIAEGRLDKDAWNECDRLLKIGGTPTTSDFVQASCWADDTRTKENGHWHYIDIPYRTDGKPTQTKPDEQNVVWAIGHFSDILKDKSKPDAERADALRYLIHFVEDVHQPLHAIDMESADHPTGDRGGNDIKIKTGDVFGSMEHPPTNLHALWDMGCGIFIPNGDARPLSQEAEGRTMLLGQDITTKFPPNTFPEQIKDLDPMNWAKESNQAAQQFAYKVPTGGLIDVGYITVGKTICGERAALAGYRLAALLNKLLGKAK